MLSMRIGVFESISSKTEYEVQDRKVSINAAPKPRDLTLIHRGKSFDPSRGSARRPVRRPRQMLQTLITPGSRGLVLMEPGCSATLSKFPTVPVKR